MIFCYTTTQKTVIYAETLREILGREVYMLKTAIDSSSKVTLAITALFRQAVPITNMPSADSFAEDDVYICTPTWVGRPASPIQYFLDNAPLKGKTVHLLVTAGSGSDNTRERAEEMLKSAECIPGKVHVFASGFGTQDQDTIKAHVKALMFDDESLLN
ncbi:MAG: hypothetical protein FWG65_02555 [Turicibacter sp.]|nr:hypothetical protein [Turicibacter sp.]